MPLFAGVWYAKWEDGDDCPCAKNAHSGLIVLPGVLDSLCANAAGAPVTWEHSAMESIKNALPGKERQAAQLHKRSTGVVKAAWIEKSTGFAHAVFEIFDTYPFVCALIESKMLAYLSATHVVGGTELIELSLTNNPARPGCKIFGSVPNITDYIAKHPPL
jgi:hypothetical protein